MSVWTDIVGHDFSVRHVQVGQWSTRVLEMGSGSPLIFMHGTGGHLEAFAKNLAPLSESHRVIAYDYPGHGYTTHTTTDLEIQDYIDHLHDLLAVLGIEAAHLSGESLGGWVALKFAAQHPELVLSLVLNTPGGTMAKPEVMEQIRSLSQAAADDPSDDRIRTRLQWLMADDSSVTDELVQIRKGIYSRPGFARGMSHILCLQKPDIRLRNLVTDEELAKISAPTLVVWTSHDPSGPAKAGIEMAEKIPHAQFELIEDAGHWPQWEQPAIFNRLVSEFLDEVKARV